MIRHIEKDKGQYLYIGNDRICCILKINRGKAEMLHLGRPLAEEDCEALCCETVLGWEQGVLYQKGDTRSCLDNLPLAWSERGTGDYRETPVELLHEGKDICPDFTYATCETPRAEENDTVLPHARGAQE